MAAVANMGEVEDVHSKDEEAVVNGNSSDVEMENDEQIASKKPVEADEQMEVDDDKESEKEDKEIENPKSPKAQSEDEDTAPSEPEANKKVDEVDEPKSVEEDVKSKVSEEDEKSAVEDDDEDSKEGEDGTDNEEGTVSSGEENSKTGTENDVDDEGSINEVGESGESDEEKMIDDEDEVHEIDDDDDDDDVISVDASKLKTNGDKNETIELNDSEAEDGEVMVVEDGTPKDVKENGENGDVIELDTTPVKKGKKVDESVTPRRSSRNLNKSRSYAEAEKGAIPMSDSEESDIEEVLPEDPLANIGEGIQISKIDMSKAVKTTKKPDSSAIVVKDTKRLVEIAAKSTQNTKKEPTLVIIDTNSILSGRGPVAVGAKNANSFSGMLPMALPAQGMYPPNIRATITPIPAKTTSQVASTPVLPTLTDDMFVVEAPSFIVPYVYEKPPVNDFKEFIEGYKKKVTDEIEKEKAAEKAAEKAKEKEKKKDDKEKNKDDKDKESEDEKENKEDSDSEKADDADVKEVPVDPKDENKPYSYFGSPLGKFFIDIGTNLVQEFVQADLLKQQHRKKNREHGKNIETIKTILSLSKNLEYTRGKNLPYVLEQKHCKFCPYKTDSALALAYHLETPHMKNYLYKCNFCAFEVRSPHDILFHMEAEHNVRGRLERAPSFHQCPSCPFEDNQKSKLSRHLVACQRKFKPDRNMEPPIDWEPPAKIPRVPKMRQGLGATAYQSLSKTSAQYQFLSKMQLQSNNALNRARGRPTLAPAGKVPIVRPAGMVYKQTMSGGSVLVPTNYQLSGNQVFQNQNKKPSNTPSISITPLPRATASNSNATASAKPGDTNSKNSFVICEICDGYIKDLEQLRNHMQWIHKVKIHPKMIYNRPPLNCQKCQFRFFTDQGLERHLLGSHGLVTSSMQDAANRSKDAGRCPVCGRVYQWKLLNHVARDHNMTLKPAHLSYKCTVCTATFGMYKQFENHVYSAHSVVAKRVMDKKSATPNKNSADAALKPLKINDEITIIPQPAKTANGPGTSKESSPAPAKTASSSKTPVTDPPAMSRAERLARRNASLSDE